MARAGQRSGAARGCSRWRFSAAIATAVAAGRGLAQAASAWRSPRALAFAASAWTSPRDARVLAASPQRLVVRRALEGAEEGIDKRDLQQPQPVERPPNIRELREEQTVVFAFVFSLVLAAVGISLAFPTSVRW
mmetsp:Transcript_84007/g.195395  ORF Transcript_84007/g.195395 Transcript_84007/m.195395 type:complete len:134 (-) Transcript_84007:68-469(-)